MTTRALAVLIKPKLSVEHSLGVVLNCFQTEKMKNLETPHPPENIKIRDLDLLKFYKCLNDHCDTILSAPVACPVGHFSRGSPAPEPGYDGITWVSNHNHLRIYRHQQLSPPWRTDLCPRARKFTAVKVSLPPAQPPLATWPLGHLALSPGRQVWRPPI